MPRPAILRGAAAVMLLVASGSAAAAEPAVAPAFVTQAAAAAVADTTTVANTDLAYRALLAAEHRALMRSLSAGEAHLSSEVIEHARQTEAQGKRFWQASGYDFAAEAAKQADIAVLAGFTALPRPVLDANMAIVAAINRDAGQAQQDHALLDADSPAYLYFAAEALGPKLGRAFLAAYDAGEIGGAAALIKASEVGTGAAKAHFGYPRPFAVPGNAIRLVPDRVVAADGNPYSAYGGAFPSGHAMIGGTDTLLLALMLPERFAALVARGEGYGYSRVVLGVHYPLDVIGSRMAVLRNIAHDLNDPGYRPLFAQARDELRAALGKRCGEPLAACAAPAGAPGSDPWADVARQRVFNRFAMTYGLPRSGATAEAVRVPDGAEVLLEALRPDLPAAARRELLARTALPAGYPLDEASDPWQRIDLYEAALAAGQPAARQSKAD